MWSRKQSVCSAVSGASKSDDPLATAVQSYPFAIALRVRVLQIVCGIGGLVVGAVGWLEEKQKPILGLGVPTGAITVIAATTSVYYSRGFGGWNSARSGTIRNWGAPWRVLGPAPCAAVPLTILWAVAIAAHIAMLSFCIRILMNIGCSSTTCVGVAAAQLAVSVTTLAAAVYMFQLDLRFDPAVTPPRPPDGHICTAVSMERLASEQTVYLKLYCRPKIHTTMTISVDVNGHSAILGAKQSSFNTFNTTSSTRAKVPLTSVAVNSGNSGDGGDSVGSPLARDKNSQSPQLEPT